MLIALLLSSSLVAAAPRGEREERCLVVDEGPRREACLMVRRARALGGEGKQAEAAALLEGARAALPDVAAHLERLRARELLEGGDAAAALTVAAAGLALVDAAADPGLEERYLDVIARAHLARGEREEGIAALARLVEKKPRDRALVRGRLARALLDAGRAGEALPHMKKLLVEAPQHRAAKRFEAWLDDGRVVLSAAELDARLERLLSSARFTRAIAEAAPRRGERRSPRREALYINALARAERTAEAVERASSLVVDPAAPGELKKAHAWALGKAGRAREASEAWRALAEAAGVDDELRREACFFSGFLLYEAGELEATRARFVACEPVLDGSPWAASARWYRALTLLLEGRWGDARPILEELTKSAAADPEADKHAYWLARAKEATGDKAGARADLVQLAKLAPTTWYGLLARKRLSWQPVKGARVASDAFVRHAARGDDVAKRASLLHALGFTRAARALATLHGDERSSHALSGLLGDAHRPWRHGGRYLPATRVKGGKLVAADGWRASFPHAYADEVKRACAAHGVDPALAWSIMRTESGFLPSAKSVVGALGLMQLMPYTADGLSKKLGRAPPPASDLVEPGVSVELGVAMLALSKRELGHTMLAVASYNGSPKAVSEWMRGFGHLEPELFVERIPYKETRDYVKKVLPAMALYRALDGGELVLDVPAAPVGAPRGDVTWFPPVPAQ